MKRMIEFKHVGPKEQVRQLVEELIDRLEEKLGPRSNDATSIHVLFDENGTHKLFHTSVTCHIPGHMAVSHQENRDPGRAIREAFRDLSRQVEKHVHVFRRGRARTRARSLSLLRNS